MLTIKKNNLLINEFPNISELYNYVSKTPRRMSARESSETNGYNFTGTHSIKEAYELMLYGDEKLYKKISGYKNKLDITKIIGNKVSKNKNFLDIVGYQADVPSFLKGVPTNMINMKIESKPQKILNIIIDGSVSSYITTEQIEKAGSMYAIVVDILEKQGYRCNLYMSDGSYCYNTKYIMLARIKTDREPFNLKKMAFPIANPSYFRRIGFKWIESCDLEIEPTDNGYGRPISTKQELKSIIDKELKINSIIWKLQEDADSNSNPEVNVLKLIERLKTEDGIIIGE